MGLWSTIGSVVGGVAGSIIPGAGTAVGAGLGGMLGGLADGSGGGNQASAGDQYMDPYGAQQTVEGQQLMNSHLGADAASSVTRRMLNRARLNVAQDDNAPIAQNNASVRNALYTSQMSTAYDAASGAAVQGAEVDSQAKERGAGILAGQQKFDYNSWLARHQEQMQPSALETIGAKAAGTFAGTLAQDGANALNKYLNPDGTTTVTPPNGGQAAEEQNGLSAGVLAPH